MRLHSRMLNWKRGVRSVCVLCKIALTKSTNRKLASRPLHLRRLVRSVQASSTSTVHKNFPRVDYYLLQGAQANNVSQENITAGDALHPETLRVIAETKKGEKQVEAQLGYSPFRPHMSFSGGGSAAAVASMQQMASTTTAPNHPGAGSHSAAAAPSVPVHTGSTTATSAVGPAGSPLVNEDEIDAEIVAEIDDSFAMLLSLSKSLRTFVCFCS